MSHAPAWIRRPPKWLAVCAPLLLSAGALLVQYSLGGALGTRPESVLFLLSVLAATSWLGRWGGVQCTVWGFVAMAYFVMTPRISFRVSDSADVTDLALFVAASAGIVLLVGAWKSPPPTDERSSADARVAAARKDGESARDR